MVKPACSTAADVGFLLDSSASIGNEYKKEKCFLKKLAAAFGVSDTGSRAGVVTFSRNAEHSIKLNEHKNITSFNNTVDSIQFMANQTRIDKALRLAQREMFNHSNGGRPGVPRVLILLTDGSQTKDSDAEDPAVVAEELRNQSVIIIVVGIGSDINLLELNNIAGGNRNRFFNANSFSDLISNEFINKVKGSGCKAGEASIGLFYFYFD